VTFVILDPAMASVVTAAPCLVAGSTWRTAFVADGIGAVSPNAVFRPPAEKRWIAAGRHFWRWAGTNNIRRGNDCRLEHSSFAPDTLDARNKAACRWAGRLFSHAGGRLPTGRTPPQGTAKRGSWTLDRANLCRTVDWRGPCSPTGRCVSSAAQGLTHVDWVLPGRQARSATGKNCRSDLEATQPTADQTTSHRPRPAARCFRILSCAALSATRRARTRS